MFMFIPFDTEYITVIFHKRLMLSYLYHEFVINICIPWYIIIDLC